VAGMYVRGLAFESKVAWQSTFLGAPAVAQILQKALGTAAAVMRHQIPDEQGIRRLNIHEQDSVSPAQREGAAKWIHLYAVTAALSIGLPRLLLALLAVRRLRHLHEHAPVEAELRLYFEKLVQQATGRELEIGVVPFNCELTESRREALSAILLRVWPMAARVDVRAPVAYGQEDALLSSLASGKADGARAGKSAKPLPPRLGVVVAMTATPEEEVHGYFLRELQTHVPTGAEDTGFLVLVDVEPFQTQFGQAPHFDRRLRERRAAWDRLVEGVMHAALSEENGFLVWRRIGKR